MTKVFIDNKREKKYKELNMTDEKLRQGTFLKKKQEQEQEQKIAIEKPVAEPEKTLAIDPVTTEPEPTPEPVVATSSPDTELGDEIIAIASEIIAEEKAEVEEEVIQDPKDAPVKKTKGLRRILGNLF